MSDAGLPIQITIVPEWPSEATAPGTGDCQVRSLWPLTADIVARHYMETYVLRGTEE